MERALTTEDMYYFQHSKDSATSYEMILLTSRFKKSEIYGAYWLLEELAMKANNNLMIDYKVFSKYLELPETDVEEMIGYMIEIGLFTVEDNFLKSVKLEAFIDDVNEKKGFTADKQSGRGGSRSNAGRKSKINQTEIKEIKQESNVNQNEIKENQNEIKEDSCNSLDNADLQENIEIKEEIKINQTEIKEIKQESNVNQNEIKENQNDFLISFENFENVFEKSSITFDYENEGGYRGENNKHNNNYNNNNNMQIETALKKIGTSDTAIRQIVDLNPDVKYVVDVIEHFSQEQKNGKIKNLPAVVIKAIRESWQLPEKKILSFQSQESNVNVRSHNKLWSDIQTRFVKIFNVPLTDRHYDKFNVGVFDYLESFCPENLNADFFAECFQKMANTGFNPETFSSDTLISQLLQNLKYEERA